MFAKGKMDSTGGRNQNCQASERLMGAEDLISEHRGGFSPHSGQQEHQALGTCQDQEK